MLSNYENLCAGLRNFVISVVYGAGLGLFLLNCPVALPKANEAILANRFARIASAKGVRLNVSIYRNDLGVSSAYQIERCCKALSRGKPCFVAFWRIGSCQSAKMPRYI